jgi:N-acetylglucosamine kinase-like BadF-type ATPase
VTLVLAVDGGNSKTLAVVATAAGAVTGVGWGGCTDLVGAGSATVALDELERVIRAAVADAGVADADLAAVVLSLAGADWPEDFALIEAELGARLDFAVAPLVVNDAIGALRLGAPEWEGIAVICGTYNAVGARRADGTLFHLALWPDRTGGRDLAADGLRAVYREALGMGPATSLTARALDLYGADDGLEVLHALIGRDGLGPAAAERMAPCVLDEAEAGDPVARELVLAAGSVLGRQARVCAQRVSLAVAGAPVVLAGGVLGHRSPLLPDAILAELPGARAVRETGPPVVGALLLAYDALGAAVDASEVSAAVRSAAGSDAARVHDSTVAA